MTPIGLSPYLTVGAVLFVAGVVCMATKRNAVGILMGVELVLNAANLNFVAFNRFGKLGLDGLAIVLNFYNNHYTIDVDHGEQLHG